MSNRNKKAIISLRKRKNKFKNHVLSGSRYFILVLCVILFLVAFLSNFANKVPIISSFSEKMCFPHKCKLVGIVNVYENEKPLITPVKISVGGFSIKVFSNEKFELGFVSKDSKNIPVIVSYIYNDIEHTDLKWISFDDEYSIYRVINIRLGE